MACDVDGVPVKIEVSKHCTHGSRVRIKAGHGLPAAGIFLLEVLSKNKEVAEPTFLKHAKEICKTIKKYKPISRSQYVINALRKQ